MAILTIKDKDGNLTDIPAIRGKSAYQYAKEGGYAGTEKEFKEILANAIDKRNVSLGLHTDGLFYLFIDREPVGNGIALSSGVSGDVVGNVDSDNNIVITGNIPNGKYTIKYEMSDGSLVDIGEIVLDTTVRYYSITNTLTNCTNGNSESSVVEGENYSAVISADSGYEISSIVVTMGGSDITPSAVSGGKISIANVIGDIVITAVAKKALINQIPISTNEDGSLFVGTNGEEGFKTGYRLSSADGVEKAQAGVEVTGYIPVTYQDIIYSKNITITDGGLNVLCFYDKEHRCLVSSYSVVLLGKKDEEVNGFCKCGFNQINNDSLHQQNSKYTGLPIKDEIAYMRISADVIDESSVIMVYQPKVEEAEA